MRRPLIIAATAGAAFAAAGLIAIPAVAGTSTPATPGARATAACPYGTASTAGPGSDAGGWGMGNGRGGAGAAGGGAGTMGNGRGGAGMAGGGGGMMGGGAGMTGDPLTGLAKGTLTAEQKTKLAGMAEEEKLAHDVYVALAASTGDARFTRISTAESRHLTEVRALLTRYGIADPTVGKADGQFTSAAVQGLYQDLVARGKVSADAALAVGRDIENLDLKDLATAQSGVSAQDVTTVYTRLANGSRMHLRAFGG